MSDRERLPLNQLALGIRYSSHFRVEDNIGEILDDILDSDAYSPTRFPEVVYGAGNRQLINREKGESIKINRQDAILESKTREFELGDVEFLAEQFANIVWKAVCQHAGVPKVNRYGCMLGFDLPKSWNPMMQLLGQEAHETSELELRFSQRLPVMKALANATINDYHNVIYIVSCQGETQTAFVDYQRYFSPALENEKSRKENPYPEFVERAVTFFRNQAWQFLETHLQQIARAA